MKSKGNKKEIVCKSGAACTAPFCICYLEAEKKDKDEGRNET
jgi:hypothetical protein|tara:strand:+ start:1154 stop:1279 length:126 start_codon:yes stop_codon:yes gene_type:complete